MELSIETLRIAEKTDKLLDDLFELLSNLRERNVDQDQLLNFVSWKLNEATIKFKKPEKYMIFNFDRSLESKKALVSELIGDTHE